MGLLVVKGALRHVCTLRPIFLSLLPRHHVTPETDQFSLAVPKSITPTNPPTYIPPQGSVCPRPPHPTMPTNHTFLPSKEKQNQTEKRQNGPTLLLLSKLMTGLRRGPPEECSFEDDDSRDSKSSSCVTVQLHFGPCLSVWLFKSVVALTASHARHV